MKTFFKYVLIIGVYIVGIVAMEVFFNSEWGGWVKPISMIFSWIITMPAIWWWIEYINKVFEN